MPSPKATTQGGLLEQIRNAQSAAEIAQLLSEGAHYEKASDSTRNRWKRAAAERAREIGA